MSDARALAALRVLRAREVSAAEDALLTAQRALALAQQAARDAGARATEREAQTARARASAEALMDAGATRWQVESAGAFVNRCKSAEREAREGLRAAQRATEAAEASVARARVELGEAMGRQKAVDDRIAALAREAARRAEIKAEDDLPPARRG